MKITNNIKAIGIISAFLCACVIYGWGVNNYIWTYPVTMDLNNSIFGSYSSTDKSGLMIVIFEDEPQNYYYYKPPINDSNMICYKGTIKSTSDKEYIFTDNIGNDYPVKFNILGDAFEFGGDSDISFKRTKIKYIIVPEVENLRTSSVKK